MANKKLPMINKVFMVGNLCNDPELRKTNNGVPVSNFRIASSRKFVDSSGERKEEACFIGVVAWNKLGESCYKYLKKGGAVFVEGYLQSRQIKNDDGSSKSYVEINAHKVQFLDYWEDADVRDDAIEDETERRE